MTATHHIEDWYTLDTLTFLDLVWYDAADATLATRIKWIEGLTAWREVVEVRYHAAGDYEDRWIDRQGCIHDIVYWRPITASSTNR